MERSDEIGLIEELLTLKSDQSLFLDDKEHRNNVDNYTCSSRFDLERKNIFDHLPTAIAHSSAIPTPGSFITIDYQHIPLLITRDKSGHVNAFVNVCRHRGAKVEKKKQGCKKFFSCPYHAWTYSGDGKLHSAPHFSAGFPNIDREKQGLKKLPCEEKFGLIWLSLDVDFHMDMAHYFGGLERDLDDLGLAQLVSHSQDILDLGVNWKLLVEGGLESYHFKAAHRETIGPYFEDSLSTYRAFGPHLRNVIPRDCAGSLATKAKQSWKLRPNANILYTLFPCHQLLVLQDHIAWLKLDPVAADRTIATVTLFFSIDNQIDSETTQQHRLRNHSITMSTLKEDFDIGCQIQQNLSSGVNKNLLFGRFEGALAKFNQTVDSFLE